MSAPNLTIPTAKPEGKARQRSMSHALAAVGATAFRRRKLVVGSWVLAAAAAIVASGAAGGKTQNVYTIPGTQSQAAANVLDRQFSAVSGAGSQVVFTRTGGGTVTSPAEQAAVAQAARQLQSIPGVVSVSAPYGAGSLSRDGQAVLVRVQFAQQASSVPTGSLNQMTAAVASARRAGLTAEFGGDVYPGYGKPSNTINSELIGLLVAVAVLLITFGTLANAGLPLASALVGVVLSVGGIGLLETTTTVIPAAPVLALMLGLACGIDYSLFISSRQRSERVAGRSPEEATRVAVGTAGGAVVFAAITVMGALCALALTGIPFLATMGFCSAGAVLLAALAALTLLPALLGFAGDDVVRFLPRLGERQQKLIRDPRRARGARWAAFVAAHRGAVVAGCVVVLLGIAIPALNLRLGLPGNGSQPTTSTQRKAYDQLTRHFGVGINAPLVVVASGSDAQTRSAATALTAIASRLPDVAQLTPPQQNPGGTARVVTVIPDTSPDAAATSTLVSTLRSHLPVIERSSGAHVLIGGTTAANIDTSHKIGNALPIFLAVVILLSFIFLTLAFRSPLVPITSAIGFLLSIAAAFGVSVAVFQWGWLKSVLGTTPGPTVAFLPVILLAVLFGLSSDYEIFVVSRIREAFVRTGDAGGAMPSGLANSARVVTAAALIMFSVFASFVINPDPIVKPIGLTLAAGVLLDAFVIRMTWVPAVIASMGRVFWWQPRWFNRLVPDLDLEGTRLNRSPVRPSAVDRKSEPESGGRSAALRS
jgi:putative drug exporter of the RND superfamily